MRTLRRLIPSMFVRRLLLIALGVAAGTAVLAAQAVRLTLVEGSGWLSEAEGRLVAERWTPTTRGRILDRKGRLLALDRPAYDVLVEYTVITGEWAEVQARRQARREHRSEWPRLSRGERAKLVDRYLPRHEATLEAMWTDLAAALGMERAALDRRKDDIRARVQAMAGHLWELWRARREVELARDAGEPVEVTLEEVARPIAEQAQPHLIAGGLSLERSFAVRQIAERYPGIVIETGGARHYPYETVNVEIDLSTLPPPLRQEGVATIEARGVDTHLVGWMRDLDRVPAGQPLDTERRPLRDAQTSEVDRGHYRPGDLVGGAGIEASREDVLRGLRGRVLERLDTGETTVTPHEPGGDVRLTIDIMLQARVLAALDPQLGLTVVHEWQSPNKPPYVEPGSSLAGAVAVLDIETGEVLALASSPSFTRRDREERAEWVYQDPIEAPFVNRAIGRPYAPGSIVKPLILSAAVTEGVHAASAPIECHGHLLPNRPDRLRCWIYKSFNNTHTAQFGRGLHADEALACSCNIYFFTLGRSLGVRRTIEWYRKFGVGEGWNLGAGIEFPGFVGEKADGTPLVTGDAIMMGIGQGPIAWTPLHAADALATIARRGVRLTPRIDRAVPPSASDLRIDPDAIDASLKGLHDSLHAEYGTGHPLTYPSGEVDPVVEVEGVVAIGKTGTATATPIVDDPDGPDGPAPAQVVRRGDHAWFVGLVGREGGPPRYAVAVMVEFGGSGGRVAGPIAEQVVRALQAEGYL